MKITSIGVQVRDKNRVNVSVDGKYLFSLDIAQIIELGLKVGNEYSKEEVDSLIVESQFGKLYTRALEYSMSRPHSEKEVRDYLYRKTLDKRQPDGSIKRGASKSVTELVLVRLLEKGHVDDKNFARFWVENRNQRKGISKRKLVYELRSKGVDLSIINDMVDDSERSDETEIKKIIRKKITKYSDKEKLMAYLSRQGFSYDEIVKSLDEEADTASD